MANSSDPARRRRSAFDLLSLLRTATAPLRQSLAVSLSALGDNAQLAFARHFDSGYDPSAFNRHSPRGETGIAVRNLSVRYGERYAFGGPRKLALVKQHNRSTSAAVKPPLPN